MFTLHFVNFFCLSFFPLILLLIYKYLTVVCHTLFGDIGSVFHEFLMFIFYLFNHMFTFGQWLFPGPSTHNKRTWYKFNGIDQCLLNNADQQFFLKKLFIQSYITDATCRAWSCRSITFKYSSADWALVLDIWKIFIFIWTTSHNSPLQRIQPNIHLPINSNSILHKQNVQLPNDSFIGMPTLPPFDLGFGTPIWQTWRYVKAVIIISIQSTLSKSDTFKAGTKCPSKRDVHLIESQRKGVKKGRGQL